MKRILFGIVGLCLSTLLGNFTAVAQEGLTSLNFATFPVGVSVPLDSCLNQGIQFGVNPGQMLTTISSLDGNSLVSSDGYFWMEFVSGPGAVTGAEVSLGNIRVTVNDGSQANWNLGLLRDEGIYVSSSYPDTQNLPLGNYLRENGIPNPTRIEFRGHAGQGLNLLEFSVVPEPATITLLGLGLAALLLRRRQPSG